MRRIALALGLACVLMLLPEKPVAGEEAIEPCISYISHNRFFTPAGIGRLSADASTTRSQANWFACGGELQTEMWISGYAAVPPDSHTFDSRTHDFKIVPQGGTFQLNSKHWYWRYVWYAVGLPHPRTATTNVLADGGMCSPPTPDWYCRDGGGVPAPNGCGCDYQSPIIIDLANDGYQLTSAEDGVLFDIDGDGELDQVAWTMAGGDDVFLALDRNGNGRIDDGTELWGNATPAYWGERRPPAVDGFAALRFAEGPSYGGGYPDRKITPTDPVYSHLQLWRDSNHNGQTEPGELSPASLAGLVGVDTQAARSGRRDEHGNAFSLGAHSFWRESDGRIVSRILFDVVLVTVPR